MSIPSRMNPSQLLEMHMSWLASNPPCGKQTGDGQGLGLVVAPFERVDLKMLRQRLSDLKMRDGKALLSWTDPSGQDQRCRAVVGYQYFMRLSHIAEDKAQFRAKGGLDEITLQPLRGKNIGGGQRIGEMELLALQAHVPEHFWQSCSHANRTWSKKIDAYCLKHSAP